MANVLILNSSLAQARNIPAGIQKFHGHSGKRRGTFLKEGNAERPKPVAFLRRPNTESIPANHMDHQQCTRDRCVCKHGRSLWTAKSKGLPDFPQDKGLASSWITIPFPRSILLEILVGSRHARPPTHTPPSYSTE